ncbi:hypothetical protein CASFOL_001821 [Castilleja foliolosa]|uniref:Myb/SANT-like DNA-binding domain-containing protein n=1 Tax=Castilleja foliolosa TaxID=1961234 RepID=A0ABD3ECH8_9LAMI
MIRSTSTSSPSPPSFFSGVNFTGAATLPPPNSAIQCKNRIDTVKKKYKVEKAKIAAGAAPSKWPFFDRLDELIGTTPKSLGQFLNLAGKGQILRRKYCILCNSKSSIHQISDHLSPKTQPNRSRASPATISKATGHPFGCRPTAPKPSHARPSQFPQFRSRSGDD